VFKNLGHKELMTNQWYAHLADRSLFEEMERIMWKESGKQYEFC